jgi:hypothetical protein
MYICLTWWRNRLNFLFFFVLLLQWFAFKINFLESYFFGQSRVSVVIPNLSEANNKTKGLGINGKVEEVYFIYE